MTRGREREEIVIPKFYFPLLDPALSLILGLIRAKKSSQQEKMMID